jgi:hypothetical protein
VKMKKFSVLVISSFFLTFSFNDDFVQKLRKRFEQYQTTLKPSNLNLYFSQPSYFAGDTVFFASRYSSAQGLPIQGRELMYLSLVDKNDSIVFQENVLLQDKAGSHQWILSKDIKPGYYVLYAYTNWMRNSCENSPFFKKVFLIEGEKLQQCSKEVEYFLHSKSLVNGVTNELTVETSPRTEVKIITQQNQEVAATTTNDYGTAIIKFKPELGFQYSILSASNKGITIQEPVIDGLTLERLFVDGQLQLAVHSSPNWQLPEEYIFILKNNSGILQIKSLSQPELSVFKTAVPPGANGVVTAQIINKGGETICSTKLANLVGSPTGSIKLSKSIASPREQVSVSIEIQDKNLGPIEGSFNVRVIHEQLFKQALEHEPINLTIEKDKNVAFQRLDTRSWYLSSTDWSKILSDNNTKYERQSALKLEGKIRNADNGKFLPDSTKVMFFFLNKAFGYETYTKNGEFSVPILFDIGSKENIFLAAKRKETFFNNFSVELNQPQPPVLKYDSELNNQMLSTVNNPHYGYKNIKLKVDESYEYFANSKQDNTFLENTSVIEDELGTPDYTLNLSNYLILPTMVDVVKELLKSVEYRKIKEKERIRVYVSNYTPKTSDDPLFVIDGQLTKDAQHFLTLDPVDVISINVYRDRSKIVRFGSLSSGGVIIVKTRKPSKIKQSNSLPISGVLDSDLDFPQQGLETKPNLPDLRPCLFWNPFIKIDQDGRADFSFYTADDVGTYIIQVFGFTKFGEEFSFEEKLIVRKQSDQ